MTSEVKNFDVLTKLRHEWTMAELDAQAAKASYFNALAHAEKYGFSDDEEGAAAA